MTPILTSATGVTLIGGGDADAGIAAQAVALAPTVVAADGGADRARAFGLDPVAVIGDFDSISDQTRAAIAPERLYHVAEQDSTDFEKCLSRIAAPFVIAVGFAGDRLDHTLAALTTMARLRAPPCLMLTPADVAFIAPPSLALPVAAGTRVSLFPMGAVTGTSTGLRWPIDGLGLTPWARVGTSNLATGPVTLRLSGPCLILLPRDELPRALAALTGHFTQRGDSPGA